MRRILACLGSHTRAVVMGGALLLLCLPQHSGFLLIFFGPGCLLYCLANIVQYKRERKALKPIAADALILLSAIACVAGWHIYLAKAARASADHLAADIEYYRQTHGDYPANVEVLADWPKSRVRNELGYGGYFYADGKPVLFYAATFIVFDTWKYDFNFRRWNYVSG